VLILNLGAKLGRVVKAAPRPSGKKDNNHCRRSSLSSTAGLDGYGNENVCTPALRKERQQSLQKKQLEFHCRSGWVWKRECFLLSLQFETRTAQSFASPCTIYPIPVPLIIFVKEREL
jgi:hypothetical protein